MFLQLKNEPNKVQKLRVNNTQLRQGSGTWERMMHGQFTIGALSLLTMIRVESTTKPLLK